MSLNLRTYEKDDISTNNDGGGILSTQAATYIWDNSEGSKKWVVDATQPNEKNVYKIDKEYGDIVSMIDTVQANSTIDFGLSGKVGPIAKNQNGNWGDPLGELNLKLGSINPTFTGNLDLNKSQSEANEVIGTFVLETRWLIEGHNIWSRENGPDYANSVFTSLDGGILNKLAAGEANGRDQGLESLPEFALTEENFGSYRFVSTYNNGIGVQYLRQVTASVPEPTTATLGLLGVAGLLLRRRRI